MAANWLAVSNGSWKAARLLLPEVYLMWRRATDEPGSAAAAVARLEAEQLDPGGAQFDDRGNSSEVIYSSPGEDDDFGDKESACEELEKEKRHQNSETTAWPGPRPRALFLFFHSSRSRGEV